MTACFQAEHRLPVNRTGLKQLRKEGRLPGIVFGAKMDNAMIHISSKQFERWVKTGGGGIVELDLAESGKVPVLLEAIQRDKVTRDVLHVDFLRVQQNEVVRTKLNVEFIGTAIGSKAGGIVQTQSTLVEVQALPANLPSSLTVDISGLDVGDSIRVGDVALPEGVELVSLAEEFLVSVVAARVEAVKEEAAEEA